MTRSGFLVQYALDFLVWLTRPKIRVSKPMAVSEIVQPFMMAELNFGLQAFELRHRGIAGVIIASEPHSQWWS